MAKSMKIEPFKMVGKSAVKFQSIYREILRYFSLSDLI